MLSLRCFVAPLASLNGVQNVIRRQEPVMSVTCVQQTCLPNYFFADLYTVLNCATVLKLKTSTSSEYPAIGYGSGCMCVFLEVYRIATGLL